MLAAGCRSDDDTAPAEPWEAWDAELEWPTLECDALSPEFCAFPFPSNVFTQADPSSPTGRRLALTEQTTLRSDAGVVTDPEPWNVADGFSTGIAAMVALPGARATGLPTIAAPEASLEPDCPTVLLDAETGRRIAHFVEIDATHGRNDRRAFMIRAAERMEDGRRYIVAIRRVEGSNGEALAPSPAFAALRDGTPSDDASVEARRGLYRDIFTRLREAEVEIADLQVAWDFTTASLEHNTGALVSMRDEALSSASGSQLAYEIVRVTENPNPGIAYRLELEIEVPLYLSSPDPGARLLRGSDGRPRSDSTMRVPVLVLIPESAAASPGALLQYGHGLLGSRNEIDSAHVRSFADEYGYVVFGVDWIGMSGDDVATILSALTSGAFHEFAATPDRLHQAMLNAMFAMRTMSTAFADDPEYGRYIDPSRRHFLGISQGAILGGAYMTITPDIVRGGLCVGGQPFGMLLARSDGFAPFLAAARSTWSDPYAPMHMVSLIQMLFERASSNGYTHHLQRDPLPGTPEHHVLVRLAVGDHAVTPWGGHVMARAIGAVHLDTGVRDIWGLETADAVSDASAVVEYDFGLPDAPLENRPMTACANPHGVLRELDSAREQLDQFFRTGEIRNVCFENICSFPELSGCD